MEYFSELCGQEVLTYQEIAAWCMLTNRKLKSWEVSVIRQIDMVFREVLNGHRRSKPTNPGGVNRGRAR